MPTLLTHARAARPAQLLRLFLGILVPLLVFGVIAEDVLEKARFAFETPLLLWIHSFASPALDRLALLFTTIGGVSVIAPLSALILAFLWWKYRPQAFFWAFSVAGAAGLDLIMKLIFNRTRPELWPRLVQESDASFPSGHSMYSMAFVVALILICGRRRTARWPWCWACCSPWRWVYQGCTWACIIPPTCCAAGSPGWPGCWAFIASWPGGAPRMRLLIVEDDPHIAELLVRRPD